MKVNQGGLARFLSSAGMLIFAILVLVWTTSNTYTFLGRILGENNIIRYIGVVLFDGGLVFWLLYHLFAAKGTEQRGISVAMAVLDFLGAALLTVAEIFMGGQTLAEIPKELGTIAVWAVGIFTVLNGGALLASHLADPSAKKRAENQDFDDEVDSRVMTERKEQMGQIVQQVSHELARRDVANALNRLGVSVSGYNATQLQEVKVIEHKEDENVGRKNGHRRSANPFAGMKIFSNGNGTKRYAEETSDGTDSKNV